MAEHFVDFCGFEGDEDIARRNDLFAALALLQRSMVSSSRYLLASYDLPGFTQERFDPYLYGVSYSTKREEVAEIEGKGHLGHAFGSGLRRYLTSPGEEAYIFPVRSPSERIEPTRPNTPVDGVPDFPSFA